VASDTNGHFSSSVEMPLLHCMTESCDWSPIMTPIATAPLTELTQGMQWQLVPLQGTAHSSCAVAGVF